MPRNDKTGPNGMGPKTGRQAGTCTDTELNNNSGFRKTFRNFKRSRGRNCSWF